MHQALRRVPGRENPALATGFHSDVRVADVYVQVPQGAKGIGACASACSQLPAPVSPPNERRDADAGGSAQGWDGPAFDRLLCRRIVVTFDDPLPPDDWVGYSARTDIDALYRDQSPRLTRFFSRRVAAEDVADLVQETFRRLLGTASATRLQIDNPEAYLHRVADNLLRNRAVAPLHRAAHVPLDENAIAGPDPLDQLESRDAVARVDAAMLHLKPKTREIFMLHRLDGLSYAEIAATKGMSVKGVEKQIAKALTALRRRLDRR